MRRLGETNNWIVGALDLPRPRRDVRLLAAAARAAAAVARGEELGPRAARSSTIRATTSSPPRRGWKGNLEAMFYSPDFGSDNKYEIYRAQAFGYLPLSKKFMLGGRIDARASRGDVPFYQLPFIELRGVPVARYQDQSTAVAGVELRWNVTPRWALVGFIGVGRAWGTRRASATPASSPPAARASAISIARRLGIYAGLDIAQGPGRHRDLHPGRQRLAMKRWDQGPWRRRGSEPRMGKRRRSTWPGRLQRRPRQGCR